ncbi:MAG TPA: ABC transporter permease [Thermoanaerobaculia bacterium]|jgi:putative ABC transport system permease protein|nr:ABC transporter permease [Thermoanaerobaculia bacterium]
MVPLARRMLFRDRGRLLVTVTGLGSTVSLILFLLAVYDGVRDGTTNYVRTAVIDLWVCQKNANNLIKSSSFVPASRAGEISGIPGVLGAAPLMRIITRARISQRDTSTLFILAFDPRTRIGEPASVAEGTPRLARHEIILDRSFAQKYGLAIGSVLHIQETPFRVAGISEGTNALLAQFAFVRIDDGEELLGIPGIASFILVRLAPGANVRQVSDAVRRLDDRLTVFTRDEFVANNLAEIQTGVLPIFGAIIVFGAIVCGLVIALMLYSSVLERREDYATLKALGASQRYLLRLIVVQSIAGSLSGFVCGLIVTAATTPVLLHFAPSVTVHYTLPAGLIVFAGSILISVLGAAVPIQLLRRIYPAEVFRA